MQTEFTFVKEEVGKIRLGTNLLSHHRPDLSLEDFDAIFASKQDIQEEWLENGTMELGTISDAFKQIQEQSFKPDTIIMHPDTYKMLKEEMKNAD